MTKNEKKLVGIVILLLRVCKSYVEHLNEWNIKHDYIDEAINIAYKTLKDIYGE